MRRLRSELSVAEKVAVLIEEYFLEWGGPRPETSEERRRFVHRWLEAQVQPYRFLAVSLMVLIKQVLEELKQQFPRMEQGRLFYRVDSDHILKTPESILEKMARSWKLERGDEGPRIKFDNLREMKDIGRFRIIANFLSDIDLIRQHLESPYQTRTPERLTAAQRSLYEQFSLTQNRFEELISLDPKDRETGERCCKALRQGEGW